MPAAWRWVHAAPLEGEALLRHGLPRLQLGVGKTRASFELTRALVSEPGAGVVVVGVCGAFRGRGLAIGDICVVAQDREIDEGVQTPAGFLDLQALGLTAPCEARADEAMTARAAATLACPAVAGVTVSTCSGTDALAAARARSGAAIETMEGAAIAWVCAELGVPWIAVRAVSNYTGDRDRAGWDLRRAMVALGGAVDRLVAAGVCT
ncbi:MAG: futalosine hydrolase [Deltaproteobacteria bacterium]|nr:futalosine hydrolase [Deltaproteobacteria bacterium]MBK8236802.1 futalosine hydrolase [Deltaproteobacteria bacterium]MBK8720698.1 futalosine hydrolase [Deltaproteobacteria bacterium]MBP7290510.1 futalosine hydrolase [Nannocystaceae bacterium]